MQCGRAVFRARFCIHCEYRSGTRESKRIDRNADRPGATSLGVCQGFADRVDVAEPIIDVGRLDERRLRMAGTASAAPRQPLVRASHRSCDRACRDHEQLFVR